MSIAPDLTVSALLALLPVAACLVATLFLDLRCRVRLTLALAALGAGSALLGLVQLAGGGQTLHIYDPSTADAPVGLFANPNHHAALLAALLPALGASAGLRLRAGGRAAIALALTLAAGVSMILTLLLTGSRMGLVLGVVGTAGAILAFRAGGGRIAVLSHRRGRVAAWGVMVVTVAALGGAAWQGGALHRLAASSPQGELRVAVLAPLARTAGAFMPLGAGFGTFGPAYRRFEPDALLSTIYFNQAHDEPMQIAIEGGLPALALLGGFLLWWLRSAWRILTWHAPSSRRRALAVAALTTTAVLMLSSLVDYPLRTPLCATVFAIACAEMGRGAATARDAKEG